MTVVKAARPTTRDGIPLFGLIHGAPGPSSVAVIYVHGLGANFYLSFTDVLAQTLPKQGVGFLHGNMRDCDIVRIDEVPAAQQVRKGGSGYHRFSDCLSDIEAWIAEAERHGFERVVLFGHSLGTLKCAYYLGETQDSRVAGLVLGSPADAIALHHNRHSPAALAGFEEMARALVAAGRPEATMPPECALGLMMQPVTAAGYIDRFGDPPAWDIFDFFDRGSPNAFMHLRKVAVPVVAFYGSHSEALPDNMIADALLRIRSEASSAPSYASHVIQGSGHFYVGYGNEVASIIADALPTMAQRGRHP